MLLLYYKNFIREKLETAFCVLFYISRARNRQCARADMAGDTQREGIAETERNFGKGLFQLFGKAFGFLEAVGMRYGKAQFSSFSPWIWRTGLIFKMEPIAAAAGVTRPPFLRYFIVSSAI